MNMPFKSFIEASSPTKGEHYLRANDQNEAQQYWNSCLGTKALFGQSRSKDASMLTNGNYNASPQARSYTKYNEEDEDENGESDEEQYETLSMQPEHYLHN